MSDEHVYGVVSAEEWQRIADEDLARQAAYREHDNVSSVLTAISAVLILAMLVVGPMWTLIALAAPDAKGPLFDQLWVVPLVLTVAAAVPLAFALRREQSRGRWLLAALLVGSLAIQLATSPWS